MSTIRQAVVLAAGAGRRLAPATDRYPKPLLPFLNRPLLEHVLRRLAGQGVERVWLNAFHHADQLVAFAARRPVAGLELCVVVEPRLLGTAGGLANLAAGLLPGPVFVFAGDILADFDLAALAARHRAAAALATMALTPRADPRLYGPVEVDAADLIVDVAGLVGAPRDRPPHRALVNASAHVLEPAFLARLPSEGCLVRQGYVPALRDGLRCAAFVHRGRWHETGTAASLCQAQADALSGRAPVDAELLAAGGALRPGPALLHPGARVSAGAVLSGGTTVAEGATVGRGARLRGCLVLPAAVVPDGAILDHVVIAPAVAERAEGAPT